MPRLSRNRKADMTPKQQQRMYDALRCIGKDYCTSEQITKNAEKVWGLSPMEALQMSYDNIQETAKAAIKGVRNPRILLDDFPMSDP